MFTLKRRARTRRRCTKGQRFPAQRIRAARTLRDHDRLAAVRRVPAWPNPPGPEQAPPPPRDIRWIMTARDVPPFRADHVGSLLRPPRLRRARDEFAAGTITAQELRAAEDAAIAGAVRMQADAGLQTATDGEFRRASWHMDFIYQLGGVSRAPGHLAVQFRNPSGTIEYPPAALHIDGKLRIDETIFGADFGYLRSIA